MARVGAACALALGALACATSPSPRAAAIIDVASYYPLEVGWKWAYDVDRGGEKVLATYAVVSREGDVATVEAGGEAMVYVVSREGIARRDEDGSLDFLLKGPVAAGTTWKLGTGEARIVAVGQEIDVPAGHFSGCIVIEQRRTDPVRIARTVLAPGVGPVTVESQLQDAGQWFTTLSARLLGVTKPGQGL